MINVWLGSGGALLCAIIAWTIMFLTGHVPSKLGWLVRWMVRGALVVMFIGGAAFALSGGGVTVDGWLLTLIGVQPVIGWAAALLATLPATVYVAFKLIDIFIDCPRGAVWLAGVVPLLLALWTAGWLHTWYEDVVVPAGPVGSSISQTVTGHG
jgi:hypothetical protein